ncbi:MAG: nucleotidyl transferase AbiEii/AbiGii toxin family protein [Acidobacteria bacterium]|nr:nucleotidyl transferase AbiEii/AbiGii toxin family protein [Acidobacteriota bacterium]
MNRLQRILERVKTDLDSLGVPWCLAGGLAVSVWGEPRLTRDIDVIVAVSSDQQTEELIRQLQDDSRLDVTRAKRGSRFGEMISRDSLRRHSEPGEARAKNLGGGS